VPQYVAGSPSPPAVRAVLRRLAELARLEIDLRLSTQVRPRISPAWTTGSRRGRTSARSFDRIDREQTASPDDLVIEIERFPAFPGRVTALHFFRGRVT